MKVKILLKILIFFLILSFLSNLIADFFLNHGLASENANNREKSFFLSKQFSPLNSEIIFNYGVELLKKGEVGNNPVILKKANNEFLKVIAVNPLHYRGHYFLAKSYFLLNRMNSSDFFNGINALKRTAYLRKKNRDVAVRVIEALISLWPHLPPQDKEYTIGIFKNISDTISTNNFKSILNKWDLYSKDLNFFEQAMGTRTEYFNLIADKLGKNQINFEKRINYLILYEKERILTIRKRFETLILTKDIDSKDRFKQNLELLRLLGFEVKGYFRLTEREDTFIEEQYIRVKKELIHSIIKLYLELIKYQKETVITSREMEKYILDYFKTAEAGEKDELLNLLEENLYFKKRDIHSFYLKALISFYRNRDEQVMSSVEEFLGTISYIKSENMRDFSAIKKLLADVYVKNRYLIRAEDILKDIKEPTSELPSIYCRLLRIKQIIGGEKNQDMTDDEIFNQVMESRLIEIDSLILSKKVFIVDSNELVLTISPDIKDTIFDYHLLQAFINEELVFESYIKDLNETINITCQDQPELDLLIKVIKIQ